MKPAVSPASFIALSTQGNAIPVSHPPTGNDALRTIAVSRLFLDNFDHLTAYWVAWYEAGAGGAQLWG